jgi:hypothetical protein
MCDRNLLDKHERCGSFILLNTSVLERKNTMSAERAFVESLEKRELLSASILYGGAAPTHSSAPAVYAAMPAAKQPSYSLMNLMNYNRRGASWRYAVRYSLSGSMGSRSGSGTETVRIASQPKNVDGHQCNAVVISDPNTTATFAWYSDSGGTYMTMQAMQVSGMKLTINLHGTRVAPKLLSAGQKSSDSGDFDGTMNLSYAGQSAKATMSGSTSASSQLMGTEKVTVPAGTFRAVKGSYKVAMRGKITVTYQGESQTANFAGTATQTFWAVANRGVVHGITQETITISMPGQGSETVKITGSVSLM